MDASLNPRTDRPDSPHAVQGLLQDVRATLRGEHTRVSDLIEALGQASILPLLLLPALIIVSPLSGIPILPSICGLTMALISGQALFGRQHIWLPNWLLSRSLPTQRLRSALDSLMKPAGWIDGITAHRLGWLTTPPFRTLLLVVTMLAGLAMPALEILPFTSSILAAAVVLIAVGLLVHDGLVAMFGVGFIAAGVSLILWLLL